MRHYAFLIPEQNESLSLTTFSRVLHVICKLKLAFETDTWVYCICIQKCVYTHLFIHYIYIHMNIIYAYKCAHVTTFYFIMCKWSSSLQRLLKNFNNVQVLGELPQRTASCKQDLSSTLLFLQEMFEY